MNAMQLKESRGFGTVAIEMVVGCVITCVPMSGWYSEECDCKDVITMWMKALK